MSTETDTPKPIVRGVKVPPPGDVPLYIENDLALLAAEMWLYEPDARSRIMLGDIDRMARVVTRSVTHTLADPSVLGQPPPVATGRTPSWSLVIEHTQKRRTESAYGITGVVDRVISDMVARDSIGTAKYGTPLTAGNGRSHLVDAYQEAMDLAVYLATELAEHGLGVDEYPEAARYDKDLAWHLRCVQGMFHDAVTTIIRMRALMEAKGR